MPIRLSVITPVRNGRDHIAGCIENVALQSCGDRIEHIVMDGLSTDGTAEIARQMRANQPQLRVISEADKGQSDALNAAIRMARGSIIGILNVDDFYEPGTLSRALEIMSQLPSPAMIVGNCNVWSGANELLYINRPSKVRLQDLLVGWDMNPHPVNQSSYFYHKALHDLVGWYDVDEHYAMDLDFLLRAVATANVRYFDETWGNFVLCEGTKTFEDERSGKSKERYKIVLARHMKLLPPSKRLWVWLNRLKSKYWEFRRWQTRS